MYIWSDQIVDGQKLHAVVGKAVGLSVKAFGEWTCAKEYPNYQAKACKECTHVYHIIKTRYHKKPTEIQKHAVVARVKIQT